MSMVTVMKTDVTHTQIQLNICSTDRTCRITSFLVLAFLWQQITKYYTSNV